MSKGVKYLLVSLPTSISPSNDTDEALTAIRSTITTDYGSVFPFPIPEFKIGTLDALVQQADDLAKLDLGCESVVGKVGDSLKTILQGDESKISQQKTVNDSKSEVYNRTPCSVIAHWQSRACRCLLKDVPLEQSKISRRQAHWRDYRFFTKGTLQAACSRSIQAANTLFQEISSIDNDVKNKYNQYNQVKTQLTVLQRRQT